jgi:acyl-CoA reductase-like NAD-dependent aldehyde dehydrogenase
MQTSYQHWIDGKAAAPSSGAYLPTIDPASRGAGPDVAAGSGADVSIAVLAAQQAQAPWAARSAGNRAEVLAGVAAHLRSHRDDLIELEGISTGKVDGQLAMEVDMSIAYVDYYAGVLRSLSGRTIDQGAGTHTYTRLQPYGVVGVITPWNLPLNQACRAIPPALAVGNAVVAKPSEFTSLSTVRFAELASEAGLPDGLFNVVTGTGAEVGTPLAQHPAIRRLAFTGSVATGRHLAALAGNRLVPMTLELGGKSPIVVFTDADLDRAAAAAANAVVMNAGQVCSATTRLLVQESVHDDLVERIVAVLGQKRPTVDFGPIITEAQFDKVLATFAATRATGIEPAIGGDRYHDGPGAAGLYIQPTLYPRVDPSADIAREEVFGPVLVSMSFDDEAEALAMANDTEYGLVASVWSGDLARGIRLAEGIDAGQVAVNGGPLTIETPFGGFKASGYGREKGIEALHDYAQVKSVSVALR